MTDEQRVTLILCVAKGYCADSDDMAAFEDQAYRRGLMDGARIEQAIASLEKQGASTEQVLATLGTIAVTAFDRWKSRQN